MKVLADYSFKSFMLSVLDLYPNYLPQNEKRLTEKNIKNTVFNIIQSIMKKDKGYQSIIDMSLQRPEILEKNLNENDFYFKEFSMYNGVIRLLCASFAHEVEKMLKPTINWKKKDISNVFSLKIYKKN